MRELGRQARPTVARQVGRRRDGLHATDAELARNVARREPGGDADRKIDALLDQVLRLVAVLHVEADLGMTAGKLQQQGRHTPRAEGERQAHADMATRRLTRRRDVRLGDLDQVKDDPALLEIVRSRRRQPQSARAALHQLAAEMRLQRGDLPRHHRGRGVQLLGHGGEAAQLGNANEQLHGAQAIHYCHFRNEDFLVMAFSVLIQANKVHPSKTTQD